MAMSLRERITHMFLVVCSWFVPITIGHLLASVYSLLDSLGTVLGMSSERNQERTFIMIKPDAVQRALVGRIIDRFEQKGFKLVAIKFERANDELLRRHYADLAQRSFFPALMEYMQMGPVVPMVWEGLDVVKSGRVLLGETNPANSKPGTIRGDFCVQTGRNIIHGSDSVETAKKEIDLWFKPDELVTYRSNQYNWLYED